MGPSVGPFIRQSITQVEIANFLTESLISTKNMFIEVHTTLQDGVYADAFF